jgi:hypothetical protein
MGKSMYDYVNRSKERARQQKQIDKASERIRAKQENPDIQTRSPKALSDMAEQGLVEEVVTRTA